MRILIAVLTLASLTACGTIAPKLPFVREKTPEEVAQEAATDRFATCMDQTLASFGPFHFGSQEARLKAAEICRDVMQSQAK